MIVDCSDSPIDVPESTQHKGLHDILSDSFDMSPYPLTQCAANRGLDTIAYVSIDFEGIGETFYVLTWFLDVCTLRSARGF